MTRSAEEPAKQPDPPTRPPATRPPDAPPPDAPTLSGRGNPPPGDLPQVFGRYRIEAQLGRGGMGAVYLARDTQLGRKVAIKIPSAEALADEVLRARFFREAEAAAAMAHPNICPVYDVGEIDGVPYLTMAFIEGEPLSRRLQAGPLDPAVAVALVRTLALALHEAHARGIVHRDLKPGNVMIDARGEPVLMDFGLARRADAAQLTQEGEVLGTPAYMPPEQMRGEVAAMGPASDIYSLGVLLYELLAGRTPFEGDLLSLMSQILLDPPQPPSKHRPGLPPHLDAVCLRALAKEPAERWPSMRDFADALAAGQQPPASTAGSLLVLRLVGSSFAYRPLPKQTVITVGRQKRRPGEPLDYGNDLVVRVPGNDTLSVRISRHHLEIHITPDGLRVIDHSRWGTLLNGRPLVHDVATPLSSGDLLIIAGVITLEVVLQSPTERQPPTFAEVSQNIAGAPVVFEATLGDMMTID
jgi:serine/threonine protein kinase